MHNTNDGVIEISFDGQILNIINTGPKLDFQGDIFKRFVRSTNKESLGIGLSIVKRICDFYSMEISYMYTSHHEFKLCIKDEE